MANKSALKVKKFLSTDVWFKRKKDAYNLTEYIRYVANEEKTVSIMDFMAGVGLRNFFNKYSDLKRESYRYGWTKEHVDKMFVTNEGLNYIVVLPKPIDLSILEK